MIVSDIWVIRLGRSQFWLSNLRPNQVGMTADRLAADCYPESHIERFRQSASEMIDPSAVIAERAPTCACCGCAHRWKPMHGGGGIVGHDGNLKFGMDRDGKEIWRCEQHRDRNPCAVPGCARTVAANSYFEDDLYLCGTHWRIACPPGSPARRVYNRLFALHRKRDGTKARWSPDLNVRYWRIWKTIVRRALSDTAGDVDMTEINKMFGWEE